MRAVAIALICAFGLGSGIGAECLPSVGELPLVGEHEFRSPLAGIALDPTWNFLAWVETWSIRVVDPRSGEDLAGIALPPGLRFAGRAALSAAGSLAIALSDGTVQVWDIRTNEEVGSFPAPLWGGCAALSADGALLAAAGPEGEIRVWDIPSGEIRFSLPEFLPVGSACPSAFTQDGRWLVAPAWIGSSSVSLVWDLTTGRLARVFPGPVELLPDGQVSVLVREPAPTRIEIWEDLEGRKSSTVSLPIDWEVSQVASHPSGAVFALALADGTIRLWDARSAQEMGALPSCVQTDPRTGELARGLLVKFSPDGDEILLGMWFPETMKGVVYRWILALGD